jgi:hypothetical protein
MEEVNVGLFNLSWTIYVDIGTFIEGCTSLGFYLALTGDFYIVFDLF